MVRSLTPANATTIAVVLPASGVLVAVKGSVLFDRIFKSARGVVALLPPSEWSLLPLFLVLLSKCTLVGEIYYDLKSETHSFSRAGFCSVT